SDGDTATDESHEGSGADHAASLWGEDHSPLDRGSVRADVVASHGDEIPVCGKRHDPSFQVREAGAPRSGMGMEDDDEGEVVSADVVSDGPCGRVSLGDEETEQADLADVASGEALGDLALGLVPVGTDDAG